MTGGAGICPSRHRWPRPTDLADNSMTQHFASLPTLGAGLGYRSELADLIKVYSDDVDWLECMTEHFLHPTAEVVHRIAELRAAFPLVPHGVELSIGSNEPIDYRYVDAVAGLVDRLSAPWFSDHLCYTRSGDTVLGTLVPLHRTRENARRVARRADEIQRRVGVPLLLENITYYMDVPAELTEAEFITELFEACECGSLLDLTNVVTNAHNHGFDPMKFIDSIPLERVVQLHLAGGEYLDDDTEGMLLDSHSTAVPPEVWSMLDYVVARAPNLRGLIIERDQNFAAAAPQLRWDVKRARSAFAR